MTTPVWMIGAPCTGNADLFFDETSRTKVRKARAICKSCKANARCLEYAMKNNDVGVWAGTTANQRAKMRRTMRKKSQEPQLNNNNM